jgi:CHAT domain-containing protein/Tfp pilus assembly protein PilF
MALWNHDADTEPHQVDPLSCSKGEVMMFGWRMRGGNRLRGWGLGLILFGLLLSQPIAVFAQSPELKQAFEKGQSLHKKGKYIAATPYIEKAVKLGSKEYGPDHRITVMLIDTLAELYSTNGRYDEAETLYKRSLATKEKALGTEHPIVAGGINNLARLYSNTGRYSEAEALFNRSLAIYVKAQGAQHPNVSASLNNIADLYRSQGRYSEAESLYKRSLVIKEKALESGHPDLGATLNNLAGLYKVQGRYDEAEPLYKRALTIWEDSFGREHPRVAQGLNNLAQLYNAQGRRADAEPLLVRSLKINEKALGPEHIHVGWTLNNLASLYKIQGRLADAEPLFQRSLVIVVAALGPNHPRVARILNNIASLYQSQGRYGEAEPFYKRSLAIREAALGPDHPNVATGVNNLADFYATQGRFAEAEVLFKRALAISEKTMGLEHPTVARGLNNLSGLYRTLRKDSEALELIRRATSIFRDRASRAGGFSIGGSSEQKSARHAFTRHVEIATAVAEKVPSNRASLISESFSVGQLARATQAGAAVSRMAVRFAAGNDELAKTVRNHQDAVALWQKLDADLIKVVSASIDKRNPESERVMRQRLGDLDAQIRMLSDKLATEFPDYVELSASKPVALGEVQKLLKSEEALVTYLVSNKKTYVWAIRRDRAEIFVADVGQEALSDVVGQLRSALDPNGVSQLSDIPIFDRSAAHRLFNQIFAPIEEVLAGSRHVFVVSGGALQSLPFGVLVTEEPHGEIKAFSGYRQVPWLAKKYALATLPSVSSLRALRRFATQTVVHIPFTGFGDPLLKGRPGGTRGIKPTSLYRGAMADVDAVRDLPPLPDTADELRALSAAVNGDGEHIYLRTAATESAVKSMDLSNSRIVAFATHGLVAGDLKNVEPALVLTPPKKGTALDDGLLTASEVAQLKLNANLVILSACNTAAGDDSNGAEGLSGLAKAFFYAGSRALLVSHWPVASDAAVKLTTGMLRHRANNPTAGRADALRYSMLALMNDEENPHYAHPLFWAPFVVVGEGGNYAAK